MKHLKTFENFSNTDINEEIDFKAIGQKIGLIKDPVKKRAETIKAIQSHPARNKTYQHWLEKDKEVADKLVDFVMKNPDVRYINWDPNKKVWYDHGKDTRGAFTPGSI